MGVILIAFERESEQSALDQLLTGRGHRVMKSANGLTALDAARREPPDLVVSDIVLPRMDGFALCRKWKQDERLQAIPFVFYTRRHDDPKYERFALELGAERFLARTVQPEALLSAVDELLGGAAAKAANTPHPANAATAITATHATVRMPALSDTGANATVRMPTLKDAPPPVRDPAIVQREVAQTQALRETAAQQAQALAQQQRELAAQQRALDKVQTEHTMALAQQTQAFEKLQSDHSHALAQQTQALNQQTQALEKAQEESQLAAERSQLLQTRLRSQVKELEATNERLAAGEARFRRVFEANPLPMWIADTATDGFIAVNDAALALYGYTRAEFLALKSTTLAASGAEVPDGVTAHRGKDGATRTVTLASHAIEFDGRNATLVSAYDLSSRLTAESELRDRAALSRAMLDGAADGCWVLDDDGHILDVNGAYCRMSGYTRAALLKMQAKDIEDASSGDMTIRLQLGRTGSGERYEARHRRADGAMMDVEVSMGVPGADKEPTVAMIRDVSQRRREMVGNRIRQRQLEFLVDVFRRSDNFDEMSIVRKVVEQAAECTSSPLAYLHFYDAGARTLTLAAWRDRAKNETHLTPSAEPRALAMAGLFTECVRVRHATSSNELTLKAQADGLPDLQRFLAVPMVSGDDTVAVLGVGNRDASYNEDDQQLLSALADGVWRVLQAKRAHATTLISLQRTDVALQGMIDSFVRLSERHDPYTAGSARRVAAIAIAIAREAGLDGERQHALRVAALLHDVGNSAVPATILAKPAPLTETELALMRTHVEEGCQLLAEIDFGGPVAEIVYQSHERYDGSGYPRGLKGEDIMIEARILGIADTVEAMCSARPYRPAAGMEAAINELNKGAGKLYDLHLVTACTRLVRQHGFALPE
jgi:PAS domain S-box-containing protein